MVSTSISRRALSRVITATSSGVRWYLTTCTFRSAFSGLSSQSLGLSGQFVVVTVASGDGGYDAFVKALRLLEGPMGIKLPRLMDYEVRIPPGGKTDALVETTIKWEGGFKTRAVDSDQLAAAIEATANAMNLIALKNKPKKRKPSKKRGKKALARS